MIVDIMQTDLPLRIAALVPPPPDFILCFVQLHLADNFRGHPEFSTKRNKTYWVLFAAGRKAEGVYSRKADCTLALPADLAAHDVVAGFEEWRDVSPVWAKHCFHDHEKCAAHPNACSASICPAHIAESAEVKVEHSDVIKVRRLALTLSSPAAVKREVKVEGRGTTPAFEAPPRVSPVAAAPAPAIREAGRRQHRQRWVPPPPPSYTPVLETDSDDDHMHLGTVPLYASDSEDEVPARGAVETSRRSTTQPVENTRRATTELAGPAASKICCVHNPPPSAVISSPPSTASPSTNTESSLSASTATGSARAGIEPVREKMAEGSSSGTASLGDIYYVGAGGSIHHLSAAVFADVSEGPVQVVLGWHTATRLGEKLVRRRARAEAESREAMDVDV
ncbi:hypothetical protein C8R43DRAFT_1123028 [Mycena crocata]|nr:hypothetical protein C8R43DRAFT_1123028 [Mycena crocata]